MTKLIKKFLGFAAIAAGLLSLGVVRAHAQANLTNLQIAISNEDYNSRRISTNSISGIGEGSLLVNQSSMAAITLYYKGSSTESVVTVSFSSISFFSPAGVADTSIGVNGVIAWGTQIGATAAYASIGGLCDVINNVYGANYACIINDARRNDPSALLYPQTGTGNLGLAGFNLKEPGGYDIGFSTGGSQSNASYQTLSTNFLSLGITPVLGKRVILKSCQYLAPGSGGLPGQLPTLTVTGVKKSLENAAASGSSGITYPFPLDDTTAVWSELATSSVTVVTANFDDTGLGGITFAQANQGFPQTLNATASTNISHVVVRVTGDTTAATMTNTNFLKCYWVER